MEVFFYKIFSGLETVFLSQGHLWTIANNLSKYIGQTNNYIRQS